MSDKYLRELHHALVDAKYVAVLTGAGVSAASGIPTFRDALSGLWAKYSATELATPADAIAAAETAVRECDLFLSLGTSGVVYPAAGLIEIASVSGARTCEINLDQTPNSRIADWSIRGRCDEVLPQLLNPA